MTASNLLWTRQRSWAAHDTDQCLPLTASTASCYGVTYELEACGLAFVVRYQYSLRGELVAVGVELTCTACCRADLRRISSRYRCNACGQWLQFSSKLVVIVEDPSAFLKVQPSGRHSMGPTHDIFLAKAGEWFENVLGADVLRSTVLAHELLSAVRTFTPAAFTPAAVTS